MLGNGADVAQTTEAMRGMFHALADSNRFPFLSRSVADGAFDPGQGWQINDLAAKADSEFRFGLDLILDGVELLITRRTRSRLAGPT